MKRSSVFLKSKKIQQSGFTLIELLVVMSILSVLVALAVQNFKEYRERAFHTLAKEMLAGARTALEAGKIDTDDLGSSNLYAYANKSSNLSGQPAVIAPGLVADNDMYIYVFHNPGCDPNVNCLEDYITVRHCKTQLRTLWYRYNYGYERKWEKLSSTSGC